MRQYGQYDDLQGVERRLAILKDTWEGPRSLESYVCEWANCRHAEVNSWCEVYIEDPQEGHYLERQELEALWAWLVAQGVTS